MITVIEVFLRSLNPRPRVLNSQPELSSAAPSSLGTGNALTFAVAVELLESAGFCAELPGQWYAPQKSGVETVGFGDGRGGFGASGRFIQLRCFKLWVPGKGRILFTLLRGCWHMFLSHCFGVLGT